MNERKKLIVAVVLFVCAIGVGLYSFLATGSTAPDDSSLAKPWYCHRCNEGILLTPAEYENTIGSAVHPAHENDGELTAMVMVVQCPKCKGAAVAARQCELHNTIFDPRDADPSKRYCPQCGPGDMPSEP
jgi:hypothetical protein